MRFSAVSIGLLLAGSSLPALASAPRVRAYMVESAPLVGTGAATPPLTAVPVVVRPAAPVHDATAVAVEVPPMAALRAIDRVDPWNGEILSATRSKHRDAPLDEGDPWDPTRVTASHARTHETPVQNLRSREIDLGDPWSPH